MTTLTKVIGLSLTAIGLLAGFTIGWGSQPPGGQVITVCPQGPPTCQFSKVREAINAAADGALILISPGIYLEREGLTISKNVTLFGSEPRLVRLIADGVGIEGGALVSIQGLTLWGLVVIYGAQATLANVDVVGLIDVGPQTEEEYQHPKTSRIVLINVRVLGGTSPNPFALRIGPAAEALVTSSEFVSSTSTVVSVHNAQLVMSRSMIKSTWLEEGLLASSGAKVWLFDTQIEVSTAEGILVYEGSDLVLQRVRIFSTHHGVLARNARLHMEESQLVSTRGWGLALVIEACDVKIPPFDNPTPKTYEGLITGRNNEIPDKNELGGDALGDVCPAELKFLKTPEGGQYP